MRSLFVLSLPRSLSTEVHRTCCASLGLQSPTWTTDGEVMNLDRFVLQGLHNAAFPKFVHPRHGDIFAGSKQFLSHIYVEEGFCYKDVVQPFVVSAWLREGPPRPVLKIRPNIAHVAFAMLHRKWLYPTVVSRQSGSMLTMMVEGLLAAEAALDKVPGESIVFDDLIDDWSNLRSALERLYPGERVTPIGRAHDFERRGDEIRARRNLDLYKQLADIECEMRDRLLPSVAAGLAITAP